MSWRIRRAAFAVALTSVAAFAAPAQAAGSVMASPSSMSFNNVQIGELSAAQTVNVWNTGDAPVTISSVSVTGTAASEYTISNDSCSGQTVSPTSTGCSFSVRFAPSSTGPKAALASIASNGNPSRFDVNLDGTGTAPSMMGPGTITIPTSVEVGGTSDVVQAHFWNSGYGPVQVGTASLAGTSAAEFAITSDLCSGRLLSASMFCQVSLRMTPTSPGDKTAELRLPSSAPTVVASLSGRAHVAIQVFPSSHQFRSQTVNVLSTETLNVNVYNSSSNPYRVESVLMGGAHGGDFPITDGCTGQTLGGNGFCSIAVGFRPGATGPRTATMSISTTAAGGPVSVSLGGVGVAPRITVIPNPVAFTPTELGTSRTRTVTIRNDGDGAGTVNLVEVTGATSFVADPTCVGASLFPGGSCTFSLHFQPATLGAAAGTLHVETTAGAVDVPVTGTGIDTTPPVTAIDEPVLPVKASLFTSITGTVTDAGGVLGTTLLFEDALGNRTFQPATLTSCGAGDRSCSWSFSLPVMVPGPYNVWAFSRDRNGNLEAPGDFTSLVIV